MDARLIGMPGLVQSQQTLLNTVVQILQAAKTAQDVATNHTCQLTQKLPICLFVTSLSARQPA